MRLLRVIVLSGKRVVHFEFMALNIYRWLAAETRRSKDTTRRDDAARKAARQAAQRSRAPLLSPSTGDPGPPTTHPPHPTPRTTSRIPYHAQHRTPPPSWSLRKTELLRKNQPW